MGNEKILSLRVKPLPVYCENVSKWKYLPFFYQDQKRYAFLLQLEILDDLASTYGKTHRLLTEFSADSSLSIFWKQHETFALILT